MLDETVKSLDEQSVTLIGLKMHVRGTMWPSCPFYGVETDGDIYIRWNNLDTCAVLGEKFEGLRDRETVEYWAPSSRIEQAYWLWRHYPPQRHWVQVQIGKDGWTVELLYHHEKFVYMKNLIADDDTNDSMAKAITKAWITATEAI